MVRSCVVNNYIGARIKEARKLMGITQVELAAIMSVDYDIQMERVHISKIECGIRSVKDKEIAALAKILNASPSWLFSWEQTSTTNNPLLKPHTHLSLQENIK